MFQHDISSLTGWGLEVTEEPNKQLYFWVNMIILVITLLGCLCGVLFDYHGSIHTHTQAAMQVLIIPGTQADQYSQLQGRST